MDNVRSEDQIIAGCCAYAQTQDCLNQKTATICSPSEDTMDYLNKMVHSTVRNQKKSQLITLKSN